MTVAQDLLHPGAPDIDFTQTRYRAEIPRLVKKVMAEDKVGALALLMYDRATATPAFANDNFDTAIEDDYAWRQPGDPDKSAVGASIIMDFDSTDRVRPSEEEIIRAAPPGTPTTYARHDRRGRLVTDPGRKTKKSDTLRAICGALVFDLTPGRKRPADEGLLVEYGRTTNGRPRKPSYRMTGDKGATIPKRSEAAVWDYLHRPPTEISPPGWRVPIHPMGGLAVGYHPLPQSERENRFGPVQGRDLLVRLGVDGEVEFTDARLAASRVAIQLPPAVVAPLNCFGGVTEAPNADKRPPVPAPTPEDPRRFLSASDAAIAEIVLSGGTLEEIGRHLGAPASTAARQGKAALALTVAEIKRVMGVVANDNKNNSEAAA